MVPISTNTCWAASSTSPNKPDMTNIRIQTCKENLNSVIHQKLKLKVWVSSLYLLFVTEILSPVSLNCWLIVMGFLSFACCTLPLLLSCLLWLHLCVLCSWVQTQHKQNAMFCFWWQFVCQTKLTWKDTSNLPNPPLKADHQCTGDSQLHEGAPLLQTFSGPACRVSHKSVWWVGVWLNIACREFGNADLDSSYLLFSLFVYNWPPHVCWWRFFHLM